MLLLSTTGRVTGRVHTVPLLYLEADDDWVVIASWGGRPDNPEWYKNLIAQPEATLKIRSQSFPVTARTFDEEERAEWWPRIVSAYDGYATYQARSSRQIPVVLLRRISD
jgi:deazaflavin-dependent oxidoreductase (nitroreductase family)